jgi:hypothetical protein
MITAKSTFNIIGLVTRWAVTEGFKQGEHGRKARKVFYFFLRKNITENLKKTVRYWCSHGVFLWLKVIVSPEQVAACIWAFHSKTNHESVG